MSANAFVGKWTYRSLLNNPDITQDFDKLEFGPHGSGDGGTAPAGVVASFYAVYEG